MEKRWNWQKARISINPGENKYIDQMANSFKQWETKLGFNKTRKTLKILFYLILCYLIGDLMLNLITLF
jgi:transcriptional regulatory protein LevR